MTSVEEYQYLVHKIRLIFCLKVTTGLNLFYVFWNVGMLTWQMLGPFLHNKSVQNLKFSKNVNAKSWSANQIFLPRQNLSKFLFNLLYTQYWYSTTQVMLLYTTGEPHLTCLAKAQDSHQLQILTWSHEIFREFCLHFWEVHGSSTCFFFPNVSRKYYQCYLYLFFWPEKSVDRRCVFRMPIRKIIAFNVQSWEVVILPCKTKNYSLVCLLKWYLKLPNYLAINHKYERRGLTLLVLFTGGFERYTQVKQRLRDGWRKGSFNVYVEKIWSFFDHLPFPTQIIFTLNIDKNEEFLWPPTYLLLST